MYIQEITDFLGLPHFLAKVNLDLTRWFLFARLYTSGTVLKDIIQSITESIILKIRDSKHTFCGLQQMRGHYFQLASV